jgi:hypothetical protein
MAAIGCFYKKSRWFRSAVITPAAVVKEKQNYKKAALKLALF